MSVPKSEIPIRSHTPYRRRWLRRGFTAFSMILVGVALTGFIFQTIARERDEDRYPPPGELVDVEGFRLHVNVAGENRDGPTVLLEHGGGGMALQWAWIQPELSSFARVVSYDRPGLGWSESSPGSLDADQAASALKSALDQLGIEGPYVVAGHSMGALLARNFARLYPDQVLALVLIDPRPTSWDYVYPDGAEVNERVFQLIGIAARFGVMRAIGFANDVVEGWPQAQADQAVAKMSVRSFFDGMVQDGRVGDSAASALSPDESVGDLPMIVLSASEPDEGFDTEERARFNETHMEIANLSSNSEHRIVVGANHYTIVTQEIYASEITGAIRDILNGLE